MGSPENKLKMAAFWLVLLVGMFLAVELAMNLACVISPKISKSFEPSRRHRSAG